jgi:hypothetical protein
VTYDDWKSTPPDEGYRPPAHEPEPVRCHCNEVATRSFNGRPYCDTHGRAAEVTWRSTTSVSRLAC